MIGLILDVIIKPVNTFFLGDFHMDMILRATQAISDETRLRILNVILKQECCVCEVMQALDISQTRASRNLKILYDAGYLSMSTDGLYTNYAIKRFKPDDFHIDLINGITKEIKKLPVCMEDLKRLTSVVRSPEIAESLSKSSRRKPKCKCNCK